MDDDRIDPIIREIMEAVARGDLEAVNRASTQVFSNEHTYDTATSALLGQLAFDTTLPIMDANGDLVTNPAVRFALFINSEHAERLQEIERIYCGESVIRGDFVIGGAERRVRAWAAFLLAVLHNMERNAKEAALWSERTLGLDSESARQWGAWHFLWHAYVGVAAEAEQARLPGQPVSDDWVHAFAALDWAAEVAIGMDPNCVSFSDTLQNMRRREQSGFHFRDVRCAALRARGLMHEDGFTGKFLFEAALPFAQSDIERIACHQDIIMDITTLRYKREYILQIENATETEIAEALSHARESWELAQRLAEAGRFSQDGLRVVKAKYDQVRWLPRDQEQLSSMTHSERQEFLDKQEQVDVCIEAGDLDRALQLVQWCLSRSNRNALTWWKKGQIFMTAEKRDMEQVVSCYRNAVALDPDDSDYWGSLAGALIDIGQASKLDEAIRCCEEGLKRNRADEQLKRTLAIATQKKQGLT